MYVYCVYAYGYTSSPVYFSFSFVEYYFFKSYFRKKQFHRNLFLDEDLMSNLVVNYKKK